MLIKLEGERISTVTIGLKTYKKMFMSDIKLRVIMLSFNIKGITKRKIRTLLKEIESLNFEVGEEVSDSFIETFVYKNLKKMEGKENG